MKSTPAVSVVIPVFNEEKSLPNLFQSLREQDFIHPYEVIVVNNNSKDKTVNITKKYNYKIINENKKGVTFARQKGFTSAKANIITTTDADVKLPPNWLSTIYNHFQNPDVIVVAGQEKYYDANSPLLNIFHQLANHTILRLPYWCVGTNLAVRKNIFQKVGGFNTNLALFEDQDIVNRMRPYGKVIKYTSPKVLSSARRYNELGIIGAIWYYNKTHIQNTYLSWLLGKSSFTPASTLKKKV